MKILYICRLKNKLGNNLFPNWSKISFLCHGGIPEHIGQLNFYVAAVDRQMRMQGDNPTIGLLICKDKNDIVAEYTLRGIETPIGVSSVEIYDQLTADYKSSLPTIEEIEAQLRDCEED